MPNESFPGSINEDGICVIGDCGRHASRFSGLCNKHRALNRYRTNSDVREMQTESSRMRTKKYKEEVYKHYGNKCNCCSEMEVLFLQIDHVNNDGYINRPKDEKLYREIIRLGYPNTFQILCANCNFGKHRNGGVCPHKTMSNTVSH